MKVWLSLLLAAPGALAAAPDDTRVLHTGDGASTDSMATASLWGQWRGPSRDGTVQAPQWPGDLRGLETLWSAALGKGYSGPLLVGDRAVILETVDDRTEGLRVLRAATGEELWRASWAGAGDVPFFARRNGDWIRSTPASDGVAVYAGGMEEVLRKFDLATGELVWTADLPERYGTRRPDFGFASSPLLDGDALFVQAASSVLKIDAATGATLWRRLETADDMMSGGAFSSPLLVTLAGRRQLVVQTRTALHGLDPEDGTILWHQPVPSFRGMNILTPLVHGDRVFTSTHRHRSFAFEIVEDGGELASIPAWESKAQGYMSSPVRVGDAIHLHLGNGRLAVLDANTGLERWRSEAFGDYWSMIANGTRILALDSDGELLLLQATGDAPEILDRRTVSDQSTWAHLAIDGDLIAIRALEEIRVFRWR